MTSCIKSIWSNLISMGVMVLIIGACSSSSDDQDNFGVGLTEIIDESVAIHDLFGISVTAISSNGKVWRGASGISYEGSEMNVDHLFGAGSISKTIFATIVLQLVEEGKLSLDDQISDLLGAEFDVEDSLVDKSITVKQLLNHTSGIHDFNTNPELVTTVLLNPLKIWSTVEVINTFVLSPYFTPGDGWQYSSTNYSILGVIIEKVTGNSALSEFRSRIKEPLKLDDIYLPPGDPLGSSVANPWTTYLGGGLQDITNIPKDGLYSIAWTTGGIFSTSNDIAKFAQALFRGDLLSEESMALMTDFISLESSRDFKGYGLGLMYFQGDVEYWGHAGEIPGYNTTMAYLPEQEITVVYMVNRDRTPSRDFLTNKIIGTLLAE